jgi:hypothetical protein
MAAHLVHLIVVELPGCPESNPAPIFPDVVKDPREADTLDAAHEAELPRHYLAQQTHGLAVLRGQESRWSGPRRG